MLEIIALVFFTKRIGLIAEQKGLRPGRWKLYTVLAWFGAEFIGVIIGVNIWGGENILMLELAGIGFALAGYFTLREVLLRKEDFNPTDFDFEKEQKDVENPE